MLTFLTGLYYSMLNYLYANSVHFYATYLQKRVQSVFYFFTATAKYMLLLFLFHQRTG